MKQMDMDLLKEQTNEELLRRYKKDQQIEVKQELTLRYLYIVKAIAVQMHNVYTGSLQIEDIMNEGAIAIMKGLDRYDPDKDNKFETFISRRIRGMIIDLVRKHDWMPRNYRKQNRSIEDARIHLMNVLGRMPTNEEIASHLQMDVKKCRKIQRMSTMMNVLSLDMVMNEEDDHQLLQPQSGDVSSQPEHAFLRGEAAGVLTEAIQHLNEKETTVISLYYVEELNMSQIAQVMQVSEPRISQIHSAAIRKLRAHMNACQYL